MATIAVTDETFESEVTKSNTPVVVDFWAEWCGPCKMIGPSLEELSEEYGEKIKIVKVNVDENPNSPSQLGVRGIPALFLFKDGAVISNKTGAAPKAALKDWIDSGFTARLRMEKLEIVSDYDHLARYGEWDETNSPEKMLLK